MTPYTITSLDPLLFGDGRPFSTDAGSANARSLGIPLPNTLAGALRNLYAQQQNKVSFEQRIAEIPCRGPILTAGGKAQFPVPLDAVAVEDSGTIKIRRALPSGSADSDLPAGMAPCIAPLGAGETPCKDQPAGFWDVVTMLAWLAGEGGPEVPQKSDLRRELIVRESRIHVALDPTTWANQKGMLFQTEGVAFGPRFDRDGKREDDLALLAQFEQGLAPSAFGFGGERRLGVLAEGDDFPEPSEGLRTAWEDAQRTCVVLATPGCFSEGWRPSTPFGLTLKGACVGRRVPCSGWGSHGTRSGGSMGELAWLAPAGSVYFFEGKPAESLDDIWLQPFQQEGRWERDGFGLALWGVW